MKKTEYSTYNHYVANVADGIEQEEARKLSKSHARNKKTLQTRERLHDQEAELNRILEGTQERILNLFGQRSAAEKDFRQHKIQTRRDLHQVFAMTS